MNIDTGSGVKLAVIIGAGVAVYLGLRYAGKGLADAASSAWSGLRDVTVKTAGALNPTSADNVAYQGATTFTQAVTNDPYTTLGAKLWEVFNPGAVAAEKAATAPSPAPSSGVSVTAPTLTAADQEDADLGYYMDLSQASSGASFDVSYLARGVRRN